MMRRNGWSARAPYDEASSLSHPSLAVYDRTGGAVIPLYSNMKTTTVEKTLRHRLYVFSDQR